jgi:hypothetical protein
MKRDMELARQILMRIEEQENYRDDISCEFEGYTDEQVYYHIMLLHEARLLVAIDASSLQDIQWMPQRLTWQGHEFLDSARDNKIWNKAKEIMAKTGGFAFEVAKPLLISLLRQQLGLPS